MTEAKPDSKPRSAFLPIMLIVVTCVGLVVAFVPLVECDNCLGAGNLTAKEQDYLYGRCDTPPASTPDDILNGTQCHKCKSKGIIAIMPGVFLPAPADLGFEPYRTRIRAIKVARQSSP